MKKYICVVASLLAFTLAPVFGQPTPMPPTSQNFQQRLQTIANRQNPTQDQAPALTKFDLDFRGGTPGQLVAAIEKATGKPLNAIIPNEYADEQLPPLKMSNVDVPRLFEALEQASVKVEPYVTSRFSPAYQQLQTSYGFKTDGNPTDDSIWYFYGRNKAGTTPPEQPLQKACRFYQLAPYLDRGLTVDDITTAIQTGWKMMGDNSPPEISFHKETKLLIAVGEPGKLEVIDNVLKALQPAPQPPAPAANFQERLRQVIKNQSPASVPGAPPMTPQSLPPTAKPPENPAAEQ